MDFNRMYAFCLPIFEPNFAPQGGSYVLIFGKLIGFERQFFDIPPTEVAVYSFTGRR